MYEPNGGGIRIPKTAEIVAGRVRKAIVRGELKPGDKLPSEAMLITEFEVSRPTIREAIRILESEGLISVSRGAHGGARVNPPSGEVVTRAAGLALQFRGATLGDIYAARAVLEPAAAAMAAKTGGIDLARALRAQLEIESHDQGDHAKHARNVAAFHRILLDRCGNVALAVVGQALQDVVERHIYLVGLRARRGNASDAKRKSNRLGLRSRQRLVELIEAGDGPGAEAHWARHMAAAGKIWLEGLAETSVVEILE